MLREYRCDLIRGEMAAQQINKEKLAELTGLSLHTLTRIRAGETDIRLPTLMAVAEALGLTMAELFTPREESKRRAA